MSVNRRQGILASENAATTVEYAIAIVALALAIIVVAGFLEASIANRVNSGRNCYTTVEMNDPISTTRDKCL